MSIEIRSQAPTRIDLAGGTLDLWPLYLLVPEARTLNVGIDLFAECIVKTGPSSGTPKITLRSEDQSDQTDLTPDALEAWKPTPALELHAKLLRHFFPKSTLTQSLTLTTRARSPAGAGLGGSSALAVAIVGALWQLKNPGKKFDPRIQTDIAQNLLDIVRDIETTVIRVPAGVQDYYGAMFGGLQSMRWQAGPVDRRDLPAQSLESLQDRILLFYSGKSRNSGINNWEMFKGLIDGKESISRNFSVIAKATGELERAVLETNWDQAAQAIEQEWMARKALAPGISTPEIDQGFEALEMANQTQGFSKLALKICGAGGGGCFFVFCSESDPARLRSQRENVVKTLQSRGMTPLPVRLVAQGLTVSHA